MTINKPRVVLFDWDDTVVDNWESAFGALNAALTHMGMEAWSAEEARRRSGPSARDLFTQLFGEDKWKEADKVYYDTFVALVLDKIRVMQSAEDVLKKLSAHGVIMGVVSNKRNPLLGNEIRHIGFDHYFPVILGAGEASADKPHPAPILKALEALGAAPGKDVWYIGDSHTDMISASRAGCTPILIETRPPPDDLMVEHPPQKRFRDHGHIMEWLNQHLT